MLIAAAILDRWRSIRGQYTEERGNGRDHSGEVEDENWPQEFRSMQLRERGGHHDRADFDHDIALRVRHHADLDLTLFNRSQRVIDTTVGFDRFEGIRRFSS